MRALLLTAIVLASATAGQATVWITVYRCDEVAPLEVVDPNHPTIYRDIMVGTHLVIVVSSDTGGQWWGSLRLSTSKGQNIPLDGRGYDPISQTYRGSCLPAAGAHADVWPFADVGVRGFEFYTDVTSTPGDWFIFDYRAEQVEPHELRLYDLSLNWDIPVETFSLTHVLSRDFNGDTMVDFEDFAILGSQWQSRTDSTLSADRNACDLNLDDSVDLDDLALFCQYWLERTDYDDMRGDPNHPPEP